MINIGSLARGRGGGEGLGAQVVSHLSPARGIVGQELVQKLVVVPTML